MGLRDSPFRGAPHHAWDFDGDGRRVKSVVNGETILFAGGHFELNATTGEVSKYYFAGASRIAVRKYTVPQTTTLTYLVGDHLGSTSLAVDASTGEVIETRYKPWGEVRWTTENKSLPTRFTFTGQYSYVNDDATDLGAAGFGLMFYNARWYDPYLNRFVQADTVVPGGVQGLDRYAYTSNNPVNYVDPSGHWQEGVCRGGSDYSCGLRAQKMYGANTPPQDSAESRHGFCDEFDAAGKCIRLNGMDPAVMRRCANRNIARVEECQEAVDKAIGFFDLDIPTGAEIVITYDPTLDWEGATDPFIQDGKIFIRIGPAAFRSFGWLGSTINHELCHAKQMLGPTCQTYRKWLEGRWIFEKTIGARSGDLFHQDWAMNELEAYDLELSMAEYFGLTTNEVAMLGRRITKHYNYLNKANQARADIHFYKCEKTTCSDPVIYSMPTP